MKTVTVHAAKTNLSQLLAEVEADDLLWWLSGDAALGRAAKAAIADDSNTVLVSAASAWEISTKHRLGKHPEASAIVNDFGRVLSDRLSIIFRSACGTARWLVRCLDPTATRSIAS